MKIRLLTPQDAEQYLKLRLEALQTNPEAFASIYEEEKNQSPQKYVERFASTENSFTFGAFEGSQLVGIVSLVRENLLKLRHRANIYAMYVTPEKRGLGIGKALIKEAINQAKNMDGLEQIYLTVVTTNQAAKQLYTSFGFKSYCTEIKSFKHNNTYYDEGRMVLFL